MEYALDAENGHELRMDTVIFATMEIAKNALLVMDMELLAEVLERKVNYA